MSQLFSLLIIAFVLGNVSSLQGFVIDSQDVLNDRGEVLLQVYDENLLKVKNLHRFAPEQLQPAPSLKMTLGNVAVVSIEQNFSSNTFELKLEKPEMAGRMQIHVTEKQNASGFEFHWSGKLPENENREVCFHISYNRATW